jgi:hypothetical protein
MEHDFVNKVEMETTDLLLHPIGKDYAEASFDEDPNQFAGGSPRDSRDQETQVFSDSSSKFLESVGPNRVSSRIFKRQAHQTNMRITFHFFSEKLRPN